MSDESEDRLPAVLPEREKRDERADGAVSPEVLKHLPPELQKAVQSFSLEAFSGPVFHPVLKKINEEHITKVLEQAEKDSERDFKDTQSARLYGLMYVVIILVFLGAMTAYLVNADKELYKQVLGYVLPFLAGIAGGYGVKAYQDRHRN